MKFLTSIDLVKNELQNAVIQPLATAPSGATMGQIYFNSVSKTLEQYNGENWIPVGTVYELPIATAETLGGIKVGAGLSITETGILSATGGGTADAVEWKNVLDKPTTLAGYGIVDAKIENGVITLGAGTITPVVSVNGKTGGTIVLSAEDVGALKADTTFVSTVDGVSGAVTTNAVKFIEQTLTEIQKQQARANIGAGTSSFSGNYNDLTNKPTVDTTMSDSSENAVQNKVIKAYVDAIISASQGIVYKGVVNEPADIPTTYEVGWLYMVGTAGTYVGQTCEVGDLIIAVVERDGTGNQDSDWDVIQTNIEGAITSISGTAPIDVTGTGTSRTVSLKDSGVTAGDYGDATAQAPAFGGTFTVPYFTVDKFGRLTKAGTINVTIPNIVADATNNGLMSKDDYTLLHDLDGTVTNLETDVNDLQGLAISTATATIAAGQTSATATLKANAIIVSVYATNKTTGEQVLLDNKFSGGTFTASIVSAVDYAIDIIVAYK